VACVNVHGGARDEGEAEGATLFWWQGNLAAAVWIDDALPQALLWPLRACPLPPMDESWTDAHLLLNLRVLMCGMLCGSRVASRATLGQMLLCVAQKTQKSAGCHACRTRVPCGVRK
jgi:hypothetical protein